MINNLANKNAFKFIFVILIDLGTIIIATRTFKDQDDYLLSYIQIIFIINYMALNNIIFIVQANKAAIRVQENGVQDNALPLLNS